MSLVRSAPGHHPTLPLLLAYVTAAADRPLRLLVDAHLSSCPACARRVGDVTSAGVESRGAPPEVPVPPELFQRLLAKVDRISPRPLQGVPLPPALLAELPAARHWRWRSLLSEGSRVAHLLTDERTGSSLHLVHLPPGARFPRHPHAGTEDLLILDGRARVEDARLQAGDWHHTPPGVAHVPVTDEEGCWALARVEAAGVHLTGWRGLLQRVH
jgi:putative transcriptional regulator